MTLLVKHICVAFTGHRPGKITLNSENPAADVEIRRTLRVILRELYGNGMRMFLSGMAEGFDLWAADEVLALKESGECPEICVAAVIPFRNQRAGFSPRSQIIYDRVVAGASDVIILSEHYYPGCYNARNDYLVSNASAIVCYFEGRAGGTKYTVAKARREGLPVINVFAPSLF